MARESKMDWFRCINTKDSCLLKAQKEIGKAGLWEIACILQEAQEQGVWDIDAEMVSRWASVREDRARKLLPYAQEILRVTKDKLRITKDKPIVTKDKCQITLDVTPSNPRGSTRDLEENRVDKKRIDTPLPPQGKKATASRSPSPSPMFEKLWCAYPKKVGKKPCAELWRRRKLDSKIDEILAGVEAYKASGQWGEIRYIPNPQTFLSQERWLDEPPKSDDRPQPERPPANETPEERELRARRERSRANFDALMKYEHIDNGMGKVIPTCEVSYNRENDPDYLIWKGERYSVGSFEGVRSNVYALR